MRRCYQKALGMSGEFSVCVLFRVVHTREREKCSHRLYLERIKYKSFF